jgi:hypothetical protein
MYRHLVSPRLSAGARISRGISDERGRQGASLIIKTRYFTARRGTSQRNDRQFFPIRQGMISLPIRRYRLRA